MNRDALAESLVVAVRGFGDRAKATDSPHRPSRHRRKPLPPSEWSVVFDTETGTDAAQQLRFGTYQIRKGDDLWESGIFYDPLSLVPAELDQIREYANRAKLAIKTRDEFVEEALFGIGYDLGATIVGFNLPFDISRLAIGHATARGRAYQNGFSFLLSENKYRPRIQVKHLSSRAALIRFTVPAQQPNGRGMRRRKQSVPVRRGFFVDVKTLAAALTSQSHSLASLSGLLGTAHRKLGTDEHGGPLTGDYLDYALRDVQVTWECFAALRDRYASFSLAKTPLHGIYSEAGVGKAYLREMGIRPWREVQPDFPRQLLGIIMSAYYGGRSEVHIRRQAVQVLYCDFLSMYPTVCTLMGLWRYVIASGIRPVEAVHEARAILEKLRIEDLQRKDFWKSLAMLVQVEPEQDVFPVRARYGTDRSYTIGLNQLTGTVPLWYTLADCMVSKLLTGKAPKVLRAIRFDPESAQAGLKSISIAGDPAYLVKPRRDDFYKRLIEMRSQIKAEMPTAKREVNLAHRVQMEARQQALKITANATSYGIFVELNVEESDRLQEITCYGPEEGGFSAWLPQSEEAGRYFHPLLGTLITGAARLMLAITERLAIDAGIDWAFCDTDSMALAKPEAMTSDEFLSRAESVCQWFTALNPYAAKGNLLKIEDENFRFSKSSITDEIEPLYCFAVSSKRHALFNLDKRGRPIIRKATAHGLGHLRPPYPENNGAKSIVRPALPLQQIGVERWQYDVWYSILKAVIAGHAAQVAYSQLPHFDLPAVSRYSATTPQLLRWFKTYNESRPYREQVKPFNFLLMFQASLHEWLSRQDAGLTSKPIAQLPAVVAPFNVNIAEAASEAFDRMAGKPVTPDLLKSYAQALSQYHLHPESKFRQADYGDQGLTGRRHIHLATIEHIGKEANRWEEQLYLGEDPEVLIHVESWAN